MFLGRRLIRHSTLRQFPRSAIPNVPREPAQRRALSVATKNDLPGTLKALADQLKTAQEPSTIHTLYPTFVQDFRKLRHTSQVEQPLQKEHVVNMLRSLAQSGRPEDMQRVEELLHDLEPVFETKATLDMYTTIIEALAERAPPRVGLSLLAKMPKLPGAFTPTAELFAILLRGAVDKESYMFVHDTATGMHRLGARPNAEIANVLIRSFWNSLQDEKQTPTPDAFTPLLDLIESWKIPYSESTSNLLTSLFDKVGLNASGQQVRNMYEVRSKDSQGSGVLASKLARTAQTSGVKAACDLFNSSPAGDKSQALRHILQYSHTLADVEIAQKELGVTCDIRHWTNVIGNCCRADHIPEALRLYEAAKASTPRLDSGLIAPILRCLWRQMARKPSDDLIEKALVLYRDLRASCPPGDSEPSPKFLKRSSRAPDDNVFHSLFRLLSRNQDAAKYHFIATELMSDMEAYKIDTRASAITAAATCLNIQICEDPEQIMDAVENWDGVLDEEGYAIVLQHFAKKEFGRHYVPSIQDYFAIVKKMRQQGLTITGKVYTILLTQIGQLATKLNREGDPDTKFRDDLVLATRRTHDFLSLDARLSPDATLLTQLINTYQRLGCFGDAYRVWELMYLTGNFNCVTVSNILDGCGWNKDVHTATIIWRKLSRDGFTFDLHNWNTFVECLCRCGQLDMARKLVIQDLPQTGMKPSLETLNILRKFAKNARAEGEVLAQIQKRFPELYRKLVSSSSKSID
ncbi:hypothetical protein D9611_005662 [Ephemerocybe angulata]|uniref:Uncharacterized protein n=1 Tax=Ephemerocybe angulata TaxID=980116 RepID=A0A8H5BHX4_9AGAR|nr:hypothetical protein D9611_005662 [Tulosesus angulatus]